MNESLTPDWVENLLFDEIAIGQSAQLTRTLTAQDVKAFAAVSGDTNPAHLDAEYAAGTLFKGVIGHGLWSGALISALLGTQFPGPGTIYLEQTLKFSRPVRLGDTVVVAATVVAKDDEKKALTLDCVVTNQKGQVVVSGQARVLAPAQKVRRPAMPLPHLQVFEPDRCFTRLMARGQGLEAVRCAVAYPCDEASLSGAVDAAQAGLMHPVLVGPEVRIRHLAGEMGLDLAGCTLVDEALSTTAAERCAAMAAQGEVEMLMKGSLHTDELIHAVLAQPALRTGRRMSHVFRFDVPMYAKPLVITDAALNIRPSLADKVDIIQNAIDFARILGVETPKVAILAAVETVNAAMPSTLDAAALCKMAHRGQIRGGVLDGPLAFDNAISSQAAQIKHIQSDVAGDADVLVAPDLESGNMLAKQLEYLAGASGAGIVVGARVPIVLTSRAEGRCSRVASALLGLLVAHNARRDHPRSVW